MSEYKESDKVQSVSNDATRHDMAKIAYERIRAAGISDNEIILGAEYLGAQKTTTDFANLGDDELYALAVEIVTRENKPTLSYLQRFLSVGYNKAAALMERMEADGIVTAPDENGKRHLIKK